MCLLVVKPAGVTLPVGWEAVCEMAAKRNGDGFGIVVNPRFGAPRRWRTLDGPARHAEACRRLIRSDKDAAIMHWRLGTAGGTQLKLCHPFRVPGGYFAHNGVISLIDAMPTESDTSTVAILAEDTADLESQLPRLTSAGNKFALMYDDKMDIKIFGEEHGTWIGDVWFSNTYWQDTWDFSANQRYQPVAWESPQPKASSASVGWVRTGCNTWEREGVTWKSEGPETGHRLLDHIRDDDYDIMGSTSAVAADTETLVQTDDEDEPMPEGDGEPTDGDSDFGHRAVLSTLGEDEFEELNSEIEMLVHEFGEEAVSAMLAYILEE